MAIAIYKRIVVKYLRRQDIAVLLCNTKISVTIDKANIMQSLILNISSRGGVLPQARDIKPVGAFCLMIITVFLYCMKYEY